MTSTFLRNDVTVIPIDSTTMITTAPARDPEKKRDELISRFIREYICKVTECIAAARRVSPRSSHNAMHTGLSESWSDVHATATAAATTSQLQWFRIECGLLGDAQRRYIEAECMANWDAAHRDFTLTMDISLSAEPLSTHVLLERWRIKFKRGAAHCVGDTAEMNDPALIYKRMTIQIRSLVCYLRLLPTHAIVQSWESAMAAQSMLHTQVAPSTRTSSPPQDNVAMAMADQPPPPFALYHLIYSPHNRQHADVNNFVGDTKSFSFAPLKSKFGTLRCTVFYGKNITTEFSWLIRSVPGRNPPLVDDNLSAHIDSTSRYWDKKQARKDRNKLSKHYHQHQHHHPPPFHRPLRSSNSPLPQKQSPQTPQFEMIEDGGLSAKTFTLDHESSRSPPLSNNMNASSPPMKCLSNAAAAVAAAFHESPVLNASTPKLDPHKEMEKIRLSTIFGSAPPVISLADISSNMHDQFHTRASASSTTMTNMSGSQLLQSIVRERQIVATRRSKISKATIMKTLSDVQTTSDASLDSSDMNCDESEDRNDIQNEIFQGYDDDDDGSGGGDGDGKNNNDDAGRNSESRTRVRQIAKLSEFINLCKHAQKKQLESFKTMDALLMSKPQQQEEQEESGSGQYFQLLSQHFETRRERLIQLKKTSTAVLSSSVMMK